MDYITIDNFEGPLDLLLHLVKESNIDILDIKIEEITDKYLTYIETQKDLNINISSSYLVLAAELMYLKSKSLLPQNKNNEEDDDEEITRENLINKLLEYKRYKELTPTFKHLEEERKKIYIKSPEKVSNYIENTVSGEGTVEDLMEAFKKFLERKELEKPMETTITTKEYSVKERKRNIKTANQNQKDCNGADKPFVLHCCWLVLFYFLLYALLSALPSWHDTYDFQPANIALFFQVRIILS